MKFESFLLERWLTEHGPKCKHHLTSAGVHNLKLGDLIKNVDPNLELKYGTMSGSDIIKEEISALYKNAEKKNVMLTITTSEANLLATLSLVNRGDEIITIIPTYMQVWGIGKAIGANVKEIFLKEEKNWMLDIDELNEKVTEKTKIIYLTSPNNPTGTIFTERELKSICDIAQEVNAYVIVDEIFRGLELSGKMSTSIFDIYENGIGTGGTTKIGLAGLRVGWLVAEEQVIERCKIIRDYTTLSNSPLTEELAILALKKDNYQKILERGRKLLRDNIKLLSDWMGKTSQFSWVKPSGGTVSFPRYHMNIDSNTLCLRLIDEEGILMVPGDAYKVPKHLRLGFGNQTDQLKAGLSKLTEFLEKNAF